MSPCNSTCVWLSMRPGTHVSAERSMIFPSGVAAEPGRSETIFSARTSTSVGPSVLPPRPSHNAPQRSQVDVAVSGVALLGAAARAATARTMKPSGAIANAHVGRLPEREMLSIACSQEELCADNRTQLVLFVPRYDLAALDKPQPLSRLHRVQRRAAPARLSIRGLNKFWLHDVDSRPPYSSLS